MTIDDLCCQLARPKKIVGTLDWQLVNRSRRISTALEIEGIIEQGLGFRITCNPFFPDEQVTIVLLAEVSRKPKAFARIDWRGQGHENRSAVCGDLQFTDAGRTHFHDPNLHRHMTLAELFDAKHDLPVAQEIAPEPESFNELLDAASSLLHIMNLSSIPVPPWSPRSFPF